MSNSLARAGQFTHYKPKRWHPEFDLIVIGSISGLSNVELSRQYGYTPQHISNILSTEQAAEVRERVRGQIDKGFEGNLKERLSKIGEKTVKHIEKFIEDADGRAERSPFFFIDRVLKISEHVGSLNGTGGKGNGNTLVNNGTLVISQDKANDIIRGLSMSKEIDEVEYTIENVEGVRDERSKERS